MKIETFFDLEDQMANVGAHSWNVARLVTLTKDFKVLDIPLDHLNVGYTFRGDLTLRGMVMHMQAVIDADLSYPIILDEDGELMDGRHRIMKALLNKEETIKAVRFDKNPEPCKVIDK
jgi:hypothetical protein